MELESDMVSTKMSYHKNEDKLTRQMENDYFWPVLSGTMKACSLPIIFCTDWGTKFPEISNNFKLKSPKKSCCIFVIFPKLMLKKIQFGVFFSLAKKLSTIYNYSKITDRVGVTLILKIPKHLTHVRIATIKKKKT